MNWILKMAWRESRGSKKRLVLFLSCIVFGVAALVAINSFGSNLEEAMDEQAKSLLGADLVVEGRMPFNDRVEALIDSIGGSQSRETLFSSMVMFPKTQDTRLVRVRAIEEGFPFYGILETRPASAASDFRAANGALVDQSLMRRFGLTVEDEIRIGETTFPIAGEIINIPGESITAGLIGPTVFIPFSAAENTNLLHRGSQVWYNVYIALEDRHADIDQLTKSIEPVLDNNRASFDTVEERKEGLDRTFSNLTSFMNLVGFIALLLGGIGVASSIHVYIRQRITTIAILHCVGARIQQTFGIYLTQVFFLGLLGSILGCLLGVGIQFLLPALFSDLLPVEISYSVSFTAIFQGLLLGTGVALLFTLSPLLSIRSISPLLTLRSAYEPSGLHKYGSLQLLTYGLIAAGILAFSVHQTGDWSDGLGFAAGIFAAFGLLRLSAWLMVMSLRTYFPKSWTYVWRQGLANLYRPNNQTVTMVLSIGLGAFLISTLFLIQNLLLDQVELSRGENQANVILFDIQDDQLEGIGETVRSFGSPVIQQVPIVTMRLSKIEGRTLESLRDSEERRIPGWIYSREMRSTYRDTLSPGEKIVGGSWTGSYEEEDGDIPISVEQGVAETLELNIGDEIEFNVQGFPISGKVGSFREVNWQQVQPNFIFVFPRGVLEAAPKFHVLVTRTEETETKDAMQTAIVQNYPNVSVIDLDLILATIDDILNRASYIIRFMALFSIITGLIVLTGAVMTSRFQRIKESVLLKTIGASRKQVLKIMVIEYLFLGVLSAATGLILSLIATWMLAFFIFEIAFVPDFTPVAVTLVVVTLLTVLTGLANSRGVYNRPGLNILRE
ncbi:MAG: FtsX-like permease family protein [Balneolales bacterium]